MRRGIGHARRIAGVSSLGERLLLSGLTCAHAVDIVDVMRCGGEAGIEAGGAEVYKFIKPLSIIFYSSKT